MDNTGIPISDQDDYMNVILESKCVELMETFHSVQIVACIHDPISNTTVLKSAGAGNIYSRFGSVQHWLEMNA